MSPAIVPGARPKMSLTEVANLVDAMGQASQVCLIGLRGYYRDTMGEPGKNDRAIYDDAIALYSPTRLVTFNANTDPGSYKPGIASLQPGIWSYRLGIHGLTKPEYKRYEALVQAGPVTVRRDGSDSFDTGMFGINIHKGSYTSVSSLGCQTIYPSQWPEFITLMKSQLAFAKQTKVSYILKEV